MARSSIFRTPRLRLAAALGVAVLGAAVPASANDIGGAYLKCNFQLTSDVTHAHGRPGSVMVPNAMCGSPTLATPEEIPLARPMPQSSGAHYRT